MSKTNAWVIELVDDTKTMADVVRAMAPGNTSDDVRAVGRFASTGDVGEILSTPGDRLIMCDRPAHHDIGYAAGVLDERLGVPENFTLLMPQYHASSFQNAARLNQAYIEFSVEELTEIARSSGVRIVMSFAEAMRVSPKLYVMEGRPNSTSVLPHALRVALTPELGTCRDVGGGCWFLEVGDFSKEYEAQAQRNRKEAATAAKASASREKCRVERSMKMAEFKELRCHASEYLHRLKLYLPDGYGMIPLFRNEVGNVARYAACEILNAARDILLVARATSVFLKVAGSMTWFDETFAEMRVCDDLRRDLRTSMMRYTAVRGRPLSRLFHEELLESVHRYAGAFDPSFEYAGLRLPADSARQWYE